MSSIVWSAKCSIPWRFSNNWHHLKSLTINITIVHITSALWGNKKGWDALFNFFDLRQGVPIDASTSRYRRLFRWCGRTIIVGRLKTYHLSRFATVAIIFNTSVFQSGLGQYSCIPSKSMIWVIMESCLRTSVSQASYVGKAQVTKAPCPTSILPSFSLFRAEETWIAWGRQLLMVLNFGNNHAAGNHNNRNIGKLEV